MDIFGHFRNNYSQLNYFFMIVIIIFPSYTPSNITMPIKKRLSPDDWFVGDVFRAFAKAFAPAAPRSTSSYAVVPNSVRTYADAVRGNK